MATDWDSELTSALYAVIGKVVVEVWVSEMAFYCQEDAAHFSDPNLDFVQACVLELRTSDMSVFQISCWQSDDFWALWPRFEVAQNQLEPDLGTGIFRTRQMPEFPCGTVGQIQIKGDKKMGIQEIHMEIDQQVVFLRSGEVDELTDGMLRVCDLDESVLIFLTSEAYEAIEFNQPIYKASYQ